MEHLNVQIAHQLMHGDLDGETEAHWRRHLESCDRCRKLLADERALLTMLDLALDETPNDQGGGVFALEDEYPARLTFELPSARRRRVLLALSSMLVVVMLAALLGWQTSASPAETAYRGGGGPVPEDLEEKVIANLNELAILGRDPWLVEQYGAIHTLEQLIADRKP